MQINRTIKDLKPGMPSQPCLVQMPPALGGALPGEIFRATIENGVSLRMPDGALWYITGSAQENHVVIGQYDGRTHGTGRKAFVSWEV